MARLYPSKDHLVITFAKLKFIVFQNISIPSLTFHKTTKFMRREVYQCDTDDNGTYLI